MHEEGLLQVRRTGLHRSPSPRNAWTNTSLADGQSLSVSSLAPSLGSLWSGAVPGISAVKPVGEGGHNSPTSLWVRRRTKDINRLRLLQHMNLPSLRRWMRAGNRERKMMRCHRCQTGKLQTKNKYWKASTGRMWSWGDWNRCIRRRLQCSQRRPPLRSPAWARPKHLRMSKIPSMIRHMAPTRVTHPHILSMLRMRRHTVQIRFNPHRRLRAPTIRRCILKIPLTPNHRTLRIPLIRYLIKAQSMLEWEGFRITTRQAQSRARTHHILHQSTLGILPLPSTSPQNIDSHHPCHRCQMRGPWLLIRPNRLTRPIRI